MSDGRGDGGARSEVGGELFEAAGVAEEFRKGAGGLSPAGSGVAAGTRPAFGKAVEREVPMVAGRGWGRGPIPVDTRKFRYDLNRGLTTPALTFFVSKVDRMDAVEAGDALDHIHRIFGIDREEEARIIAFDRALFFEHTLNGASMLQPGRGQIIVDGTSIDIEPIKMYLGENQRRFFRAFADNIAEFNRLILADYDPYNHVAAERVSQLRQVATERGLHKYPYLAHDSSDACALSHDERLAVIASKRAVIPSSVNQVDAIADRVPSAPKPVNQAPAGGLSGSSG